MSNEVPAPTQVLTLVLLAWAAGVAVFGAWSRLWKRDGGEPTIQAGHFKVIWLVTTGLALAAGFGYAPAWFVAGAALLTFLAIYRGLDLQAGLVTAGVAIGVLIVHGPVFGLAAAALTGAVSNAMLLGHWNLNQPRLGTKPIERLVWALWASIVVFVVSAGALAAAGLEAEASVATLGAVTGGAFALFAAMLTAVVHHLVRTRSIMSATGILYLEVLLCLVAGFTGSLAALA